MNKIIHVNKNGNSVGPYEEEQVRNLLKLGLLKPSDYYWQEGMSDWAPLESFAQSCVQKDTIADAVSNSPRKKESDKKTKRALTIATKAFITCTALALIVFNVNWLKSHWYNWDALKVRLASLKDIKNPIAVGVKAPSNAPVSPETTVPPTPTENIPQVTSPIDPSIASNPTISSETEWIISHQGTLPKEVILIKEVEFPAVLNNAVIGSIKKPPKSVVKLEQVDLTNAIISFNGGRVTAPLNVIDINELVFRLKSSTANLPATTNNTSIQNSKALSISKLPANQRDFILQQLSSQYLVLENSEVLHIRKPKPVVVSSNLDYQKRFSSSSVTDCRLLFDEKELTKRDLYLFDSKVSQSLGDNKYLINQNNVMLEIPGVNHLVDGESVSGLAKLVGTYEYTTVRNANRRIPRYMLVNFSKANTELLNQMLESGQSFQVVWPVMLRCSQCSGLGKIKSKHDELDYVICNVCEGKREFNGGKLYTVVK